MKIQGSGNGLVGLDVFEPGALQCPVRADIESVRFAKELANLQLSKIYVYALANERRAEPLLS